MGVEAPQVGGGKSERAAGTFCPPAVFKLNQQTTLLVCWHVATGNQTSWPCVCTWEAIRQKAELDCFNRESGHNAFLLLSVWECFMLARLLPMGDMQGGHFLLCKRHAGLGVECIAIKFF